MTAAELSAVARAALHEGRAIPAHPLALDAAGAFDERAQRALTRYYLKAGAGGLAVGVHTTQFEIRQHGLLRPVLELAATTARAATKRRSAARRPLLIAGVCGDTAQAVREAALARELGYDLGLLSLAAFADADEDAMLTHARAVGEVLPLFGFYLQPAVGGRVLSRTFWRCFAALPAVCAIKLAPFDRYRTLEALRGVAESGRAAEVALYTGNDDHIVHDLLARHRLRVGGVATELHFVGGLLGHWAVWTERAVALHKALRGRATRPDARRGRAAAAGLDRDVDRLAVEVTDMNAAVFDATHGFRGCIAGIQEVLYRQGLLSSPRCLDPTEALSPGQAEEITRVVAAYPHLVDDEFVAEHREAWLGA